MLPQRRKSAEEIAKLRESMGIPGAAAPVAEEAAVAEEEPAAPEEAPVQTTAVIEEAEVPDGAEVPEAGEAPAEEEAPLKIGAPLARAEALPPGVPKPVRSLRKSERRVVERKAPSRSSGAAGIPVRRRSDDELLEMRRIQAAPPDQAIAHIQQLAVPWPLVTFGYLLPLAGVMLGGFAAWSPGVARFDFPAEWIGDLSRQPWLAQAGIGALALCCGSAFALCGWIALKKPRSRHHAGFISLIALLVLVFGILQLTSTHGP